MSHLFSRTKDIRFQHCDPAGIVFYPQYLMLFHELLEDWFTHGLGLPYPELVSERRLGIPTASLTCQFQEPSRLGDALVFDLAVTRLGRTSAGLRLRASLAQKVRVIVDQVVVLASLQTLKPQPWPEPLKSEISRFQTREGTRP